MLAETLPAKVHLFGNLLTFRARPRDTDEAFALIECVTAPGAGAPPNTHREDEAFLVLDGTVEFSIGDEVRTCRAGDFVKIPNNRVHAFRNVGTAPSRMLIMNWPGRDHVGFFSAAGEAIDPASNDFPPFVPPDPAAVTALGARHNIHFLPPPRG